MHCANTIFRLNITRKREKEREASPTVAVILDLSRDDSPRGEAFLPNSLTMGGGECISVASQRLLPSRVQIQRKLGE